MADDLYFDGDPAEDSNRRRLERVIKGGPPRRRWPWVMAILAGGAWTAWKMTHPKSPQPPGAGPSQPDRNDPGKTARG